MPSEADDIGWNNIVWPSENRAAIGFYHRTLPHWRLDGGLYFVTFRLGDSIPREVVLAWYADRAAWLTANGVTCSPDDPQWQTQYERIPSGVRNAYEREMVRKVFVELDACHGSCLLRSPDLAQIVADALHHFHGSRLRCGDFVVMPNHVHWLVIPENGHELEDILQSIKRWTANNLNELRDTRGRVWQKESFDHLVRGPEELDRIRGYMRDNPTKAKLKAGEYIHYSVDWL